MEAVPRLPMISFDLKLSPEATQFGPKLKQYIADAYSEDPEPYSNEIRQLEALRASAVRPVMDVSGCQTLKRYFCQLHYLQSRFPMGKGEIAAVTFSWRDVYASMVCSLADIKFELVSILYNIGAMHTQLGAQDSRTTSDGMKMACTHFQCAAWAFQYLRQNYPQPAGVDLAPEVMQYMQQLCLAQAQECILEKSMLDNRKAVIIAKVGVQVVDYYHQALNTLQTGGDEGSIAETIGSKTYKEWRQYLKFKIAYHTCISLLYQGQQAEEQQKMGERVCFYHAASQELESARKLAKGMNDSSVIGEAIAFTMDVVEGKKKAATNENEFIYHEEVPDRSTLQLVKGASLVKGIPFNFNDVEVSGPDIFGRLVPLQAHEASSIYSEEKAQLLRRIAAQVDEKDAQLDSYINSLQFDSINQAVQVILNGVKMTDLPPEVVDRAASISARPEAIQSLVNIMSQLANIYHDVESSLEEIKHYFEEDEVREKEYETIVGARPPSMVTTELRREAGKYAEAHQKANESNQNLHRAMTLHMNNLKLLSLPLDELRQHIPTLRIQEGDRDIEGLKELQRLVGKVNEMKQQRLTLVAQLRESVNKDDVTDRIVTKPADQPLDALFQQEMQKHQHIVNLIEQNLIAQDNIMQALTDSYARHSHLRKSIIDILEQRDTTIHALTSSYDAYEDLVAKANKGIDFYRKLETSVTKLLQRVKSTCKVQDEERESNLTKNRPVAPIVPPTASDLGESSGGLKLKDYLASMKRGENLRTYPTYPTQPELPPVVVPSVRPAPVGSEGTNEMKKADDYNYANYGNYSGYDNYQTRTDSATIKKLEERMAHLMSKQNDKYQTYNQPSGTFYGQQMQYMDPNNPYVNQYYPPDQHLTFTSSVSQTHTTNINPKYTPTAGTEYIPTQYQNYAASTATYPQSATPNAYPNASTYNYPTQVSTADINSRQSVTPNAYPNASTYNYPTQASTAEVNYPPSQAYYPPASSAPTYSYPVTPTPNAPTQYYPQTSNTTTQSYQYPTTQASTNPQYYQTPSTQQYPASNPPTSNSPYQVPPSVAPANTPGSSSPYHVAPTEQYQANQLYNYPTTSQPYPVVSSASQQYKYSTSQPTSVSQYSYSEVQTTVSDPQYSYPASQTSVPVVSASQQYNYPVSQADGIVNPQYSQYYYQQENPANYYGHPGYSFDPITGEYKYSSGFQNNSEKSLQDNQYYTSAGNNQTNQTTSEQYQPTTQPSTPGTYYSPPYGRPGQFPVTPSPSGQPQSPLTYMNSNSFGSNTVNITTSSVVTSTQEKVTKNKSSNIDLLADIDFNIPYEPLTPQTKNEYTVIEQTVAPPKEIKPVVEVKPEQPKQEKVWVKKDPLENTEVLTQFTQEVEKFEKFVENISNKTLNGPTPLDLKWKELQDIQDKDGLHYNISVARCYPIKNRFPDILPYDHSRVEMPTTKDDYINASNVNNLSPSSPNFILTQAPLHTTLSDFWTMVWEQQSEIIVCLLNDSELKDVYYPTEKGQDLVYGRLRLSLESVNIKSHWTERTITISVIEPRMTRVVIHLQFTSWPSITFPSSPGPFLGLVCEVLNYHTHQRSLDHPIVVHCDAGIGRTGLLCLLAGYITQPAPLPDIIKLIAKISQHRKQCIRDRGHLKFAYQAILYHAQDLLMKRGILTSRSSFEESIKPKTHTRHPSQDLLLTNAGLNEREAYTANGRRGSNISNSSILSDRSSPRPSQKAAEDEVKSLASLDPLSSLDPLWTIKKTAEQTK